MVVQVPNDWIFDQEGFVLAARNVRLYVRRQLAQLTPQDA